MRKVSIIIPTFNEEDNVGNLVNQIDYALKGINYITIDDTNLRRNYFRLRNT